MDAVGAWAIVGSMAVLGLALTALFEHYWRDK